MCWGTFLTRDDKVPKEAKAKEALGGEAPEESDGVLLPVRRNHDTVTEEYNTKLPLYTSRGSVAGAGDVRSPDTIASGTFRQLHCIESQPWNKLRQKKHLLRFPYSGDPGEKMQMLDKFRKSLELRLRTKKMKLEDKFFVTNLPGNSFKLTWRSVSANMLPKDSLNPKYWSGNLAAR
jgi:hypothetical protein